MRIDDWLNDFDRSSVANENLTWFGPDTLTHPYVPTLWNTQDFYATAIALGLRNEETILQTLVFMELLEEMTRKNPALDWNSVAPVILSAIAIGAIPDGTQQKFFWTLRLTVWRWRLRKASRQFWNRVDKIRLSMKEWTYDR